MGQLLGPQGLSPHMARKLWGQCAVRKLLHASSHEKRLGHGHGDRGTYFLGYIAGLSNHAESWQQELGALSMSRCYQNTS